MPAHASHWRLRLCGSCDCSRGCGAVWRNWLPGLESWPATPAQALEAWCHHSPTHLEVATSRDLGSQPVRSRRYAPARTNSPESTGSHSFGRAPCFKNSRAPFQSVSALVLVTAASRITAALSFGGSAALLDWHCQLPMRQFHRAVHQDWTDSRRGSQVPARRVGEGRAGVLRMWNPAVVVAGFLAGTRELV